MKKFRFLLFLFSFCLMSSCQINQPTRIGYYERRLYSRFQRMFHYSRDEFNSMEFDSIVKSKAPLGDTVYGQLLATQSMLYFAPNSSIELTDSCARQILYLTSRTIKVNGTWRIIEYLKDIQELGGVAYHYSTRENKYGVCAEGCSTALFYGFEDPNILYIINCKVVFYHTDKIVTSVHPDNWCVYYNDRLFDYECIEYSWNNLEILSLESQ